MTVSSILSLAALLSNKEDIAESFANGTVDYTDPDVKKLLIAYNLVISELSEEVEPILYKEDMTSQDGIYYFADFTKHVKEVVKVEAGGEEINFFADFDHIETKATSVTVTYDYLPDEAASGSVLCPYDESVFSKRVLAKACASEYLLTIGLFEEAVVFRKSFENAVTTYALRKKRNKMRARLWA